MKINLDNRETKLFIILLLVLGAVYYNNKVFKPGRKRIRSLSESEKYLKEARDALKKEAPDISSLEAEMKIIEEKISQTKLRFEKIGNRIPRLNEFDDLLKAITGFNSDKGLQFLEVSPANKKQNSFQKTNKDVLPAEYLINEFNIIVAGKFANIAGYTEFLEKLSPFLSITNAEIKSQPENTTFPLTASIKVSIILSSKKSTLNKEPAFTKLKPEKSDLPSPFLEAKIKEIITEKKAPLTEDIFSSFPEVSGVLVFGEDFRVIIEDELYKQGDKLKNFIIEQITPSSLTIKHESGQKKNILI